VPELPEVETIRRDLDAEVRGRKITSVEVNGARSVRRHRTRNAFIELVQGRKIVRVDRRGKYLLARLDSGDILVIHLGMSGQLLLDRTGKEQPRPKHTHVVFKFARGAEIRFVDPRTFGEVFVTTPDTLLADVPELNHLGFDPLVGVMSWQHFGQLVSEKSRKMKDLLMDQKFLAGIGNIYSDEILWAAGLRYDRLSDSLSSQEVRRLYRSMVEVLQEAIRHRGSSLSDEQYRDLFGETGQFASRHQVYNREGELCRRCRHPISRIRYGGRSHFFCEQCQT
jgi:formamidopyrimidine-DNA glycosylase